MKLPRHPPHELSSEHADLVPLGTDQVLWRVHSTSGPYVLPWDRLRHVGPTTGRWDPQLPPLGTSARGVLYAALDVTTVVAEVFQDTRVVDRVTWSPHLTGWHPARNLTLLDLTGTWPVRQGASHVLTTGPRSVCRAWACAIDTRWPDLDGLFSASAMTGAPTVTLFTTAADAFPPRPVFSRPLSHPELAGAVRRAAATVGYRLL